MQPSVANGPTTRCLRRARGKQGRTGTLRRTAWQRTMRTPTARSTCSNKVATAPLHNRPPKVHPPSQLPLAAYSGPLSAVAHRLLVESAVAACSSHATATLSRVAAHAACSDGALAAWRMASALCTAACLLTAEMPCAGSAQSGLGPQRSELPGLRLRSSQPLQHHHYGAPASTAERAFSEATSPAWKTPGPLSCAVQRSSVYLLPPGPACFQGTRV